MSGNYQHNHRGGWNDMSFNGFNHDQFPHHHGFHYANNGHPPHQAPRPTIPTAVPPHPHDPYFHHADNGYPPHQALRRTIPTTVQPLPHNQDFFHNADNRYPPHQATRPTIPTTVPPLRHNQDFHNAGNGYPPHQAPRPTIPTATPPHPHNPDFHNADNRYPSHQAPRSTIPTAAPPHPHNPDFHNADNRYPPHQAPRPTIPTTVPPLPHNQDFHNAGNGYPPHQAPRPTIPTPIPPLPHTRDFHHANNGCPRHQAPRPTIPTVVPPLPHTRDFNHADNGYLPHQAPIPTVPTAIPPLPHTRDFHHADNGYPPHQALGPTIPTVVPPLPHTRDFPHADNGYPPHQVLGPTIPTAVPPLPHTRDFHHADNGYPPHQALGPTIPTTAPPLPHTLDFHYADNRHPPHQALGPPIPTAIPPHQMSEPTIPAIVSPPRALEPTIPDVVPVQLPPKLVCEICVVVLPRGEMEEHKKGRRHRRTIQEQIDQLPRQKSSNGHEAKHTPAIVSPHQTLEPTTSDVVPVQLARKLVCEICDVVLTHGNKEMHNNGRRHQRRLLEQIVHLRRQKNSNGHEAKHTPAMVSPHQMLEPTIPDVVPIQLPPKLVCEICDVHLPRGQMEEHKKGRRHRRTVQEQIEQLKRQKASNGSKAIHTPNYQVSPAGQPKNKKVPKAKENRHAVKNVSFKGPFSNSKKVLKSKKNGCVVENVNFKGPFFNSKYKDRVVKGSERKHGDDSGSKDWRFEVEIVSHEAPIFKNKNVPAEGSEKKPLDNTGAKNCGFKRKIEEAAGGEYMKMNNAIRKQMKSSKPEVNALSISVKSQVQVPELTPSSRPATSPIIAPTDVEGSSQFQVSQGKEHHEIQNPTVEKNDQNQSTPMELRASVVSNVSSETEDMSCDFAAITVAPPEKGDSQTEMLEDKDHNEIQRKPVVSDDHQQLISVELHAPASSNINTQTEDVNSDSLAIEIEPESFTKPQAVGSSFDPQTELVLHTEMEHQVSDAISCCDSQHPAKETDFQMLPSVVMELDVPSVGTTNTQTVGGNYKDEANLNVLATELVIPQLSQVSVCLKCGDEGFEEALVYCNKCQIYALHRYCLDGPVVINDDVIWFCEDCEETVADTSSQHQCNLLPFERSDHESSAKVTNKQQNQHIAAEEVLLLTYRHSPSHHRQSKCSNESEESEEEKVSKKDSQQFPESEADSDEDCVINIDPQPIVDPIWRGCLHLSNQSFGTITGLAAHASNLACPKVHEEARLFPHVLCASLLQRSTVWPKSFMESEPDHQSIALYFFPETERVERAFDNLIHDMITKDLAITTMVENAELLVFPSTVLPIQYRRFQAKYYLWGVFRAKNTSPNTNDVVPEEDTSAIINSSPLIL